MQGLWYIQRRMSTRRRFEPTATEADIIKAIKKHCMEELSLNATGANYIAKETIRTLRRLIGTKRSPGAIPWFRERHAAGPKRRARR